MTRIRRSANRSSLGRIKMTTSAVVRAVSSNEFTPGEISSLRALFDAAWPNPDDPFTAEDFDHTFGGMHFLVEEEGGVASHASVIERELHTGGHRLATGYVEGVATLPAYRGRGFASAIMQEVGKHIDRTYRLGALGTGLLAFYGRLGWIVWGGPTGVRTDRGLVPTPEEDEARSSTSSATWSARC
jgi:aminoglycoside 2'-N-acetyltransferase I